MAITIDWSTLTINVPKSDLTLLSAGPPEIRGLNVDDFRLALKDIEDGEGMPYLDTHQHFSPVALGSLTLARVVEIINGYTITFEDGQYVVEITGGNSNIIDVANPNQVSLRANNSAGLVQVASGSGLSTEQDAALTFIKDVVEADEEFTATTAVKKHKTTKAVLVSKAVSGGQVANPPIVINE